MIYHYCDVISVMFTDRGSVAAGENIILIFVLCRISVMSFYSCQQVKQLEKDLEHLSIVEAMIYFNAYDALEEILVLTDVITDFSLFSD
jgi:hypothetical protein